MFLIIPEKNRSKKFIWISKIIAVMMFFGVVILVVLGVVLITDYNDLWGIAPVAVAAAISLTQIIAGLALYKKNH